MKVNKCQHTLLIHINKNRCHVIHFLNYPGFFTHLSLDLQPDPCCPPIASPAADGLGVIMSTLFTSTVKWLDSPS
ncbi:hypothetical protein Hanom_Chr12g01066851 [Helianthus anomalus]